MRGRRARRLAKGQKMEETADSVTVVLRIPGKWSGPRELIERMPEGFRVSPDSLVLPSGERVEFGVRDADDQFAQVFRSACRQPASKEELATVDSYDVNVVLIGAGGSMQAAHTMMQAGAAIVRAGGAGVFIDNSALAHGGQDWLLMTDDGDSDALSFAFVSIIRGREEVWTMGMHVLGFRDIVMKRADIEEEGFDIVEVIRYVCRGEKPIDNGHVLADLSGPRFQVFTQDSDDGDAESPMHNPFGRMKLVSLRDIAETN
jgi:hypothetical protein